MQIKKQQKHSKTTKTHDETTKTAKIQKQHKQ